jgi:hypothetical protein
MTAPAGHRRDQGEYEHRSHNLPGLVWAVQIAVGPVILRLVPPQPGQVVNKSGKANKDCRPPLVVRASLEGAHSTFASFVILEVCSCARPIRIKMQNWVSASQGLEGDQVSYPSRMGRLFPDSWYPEPKPLDRWIVAHRIQVRVGAVLLMLLGIGWMVYGHGRWSLPVAMSILTLLLSWKVPRSVKKYDGRQEGLAAPDPAGDLPLRDRPRRFTKEHASLLSQLQPGANTDWSSAALFACLEQLLTSTVTEADRVAVLDAWPDGPDAFCVVYQTPYADGNLGIRRTTDDAPDDAPQRRKKYRPGDMTVGYDLGAAELPDPVMFGWMVADFDIGEPGSGPLRQDPVSGISWWGSLGDAFPTRHPAS